MAALPVSTQLFSYRLEGKTFTREIGFQARWEILRVDTLQVVGDLLTHLFYVFVERYGVLFCLI